MADAVRRFLSAQLHYCGFIPDDRALPRAELDGLQDRWDKTVADSPHQPAWREPA